MSAEAIGKGCGDCTCLSGVQRRDHIGALDELAHAPITEAGRVGEHRAAHHPRRSRAALAEHG